MIVMTDKKQKKPFYENQLRYLSQSVRLQEAVHPRLVRLTILSISLSVAVFTGWAAIANINEVARPPGEIVPQGFQQVVQHFEGGIVSDIMVSEGQMVEEGDVLLLLKGAGTAEDLKRAQAQQTSFRMQEERLHAFVDGRTPDFSNIPGVTDKMIGEQKKVFSSMIDSREKEKKVLEDQIAQKHQSIGILESRLGTAGKNLSIARNKHEKLSGLASRGSLPEIEFLESQQEVNTQRGAYEQIRQEINQARSELQEYQARLQSMAADRNDEAYQQLDAVRASIAQNEDIIAKARDRVVRLEVRAPVRGLVKGLSVNTIGGVVQPGQNLMEIVPLDKSLVVEARIPPQFIGNLKPGQPVQVKVSSYDFSRYGAISGKLDSISATTFTGEKGERFFRGRIVLDSNHVGKKAGTHTVMPGMTVMVDIITGQKTILEYLVKPIHRSLLTAFSER